MNILKYFLCAFFGHQWMVEQETMIDTKYQKTSNCYEICKRCGEQGEPYGATTLGPFKIEIEEKL